MVDGRGRIAWRSPQAQCWLAEFFTAGQAQSGATWLGGGAAADSGGTANTVRRHTAGDGRTLMARRLGDIGLGGAMWLLSLQQGEASASRLATASLTPRVTEVLSWVAKGKTNRDVADILGLSSRTVNKHLEHVFEKLGVETRAAATALASRELV